MVALMMPTAARGVSPGAFLSFLTLIPELPDLVYAPYTLLCFSALLAGVSVLSLLCPVLGLVMCSLSFFQELGFSLGYSCMPPF